MSQISIYLLNKNKYLKKTRSNLKKKIFLVSNTRRYEVDFFGS
jgi:hypothetical protein